MASTNKTPKLGLSQFEGGDKTSWLGDYNADMAVIDEKVLDKAGYDPDNAGTNVYEAINHKLTGYSKPTQATPVAPTDSTLTAIGKVEKGLDGKGDMSKSVYDTTNSGKVDTAKIADEAKKIDWTGVENRPISLPNPKSLTLQQNSTTSETYDGSLARTFNVTPDGIGAAKLENGKVPHEQLPINDTTNSTSVREVGSANAVRKAKEEAVTASGTQADTKIEAAIKGAVSKIEYSNAGLPNIANIKQGLDDIVVNKEAIGDPSLLAKLSAMGATNWDDKNFPKIFGSFPITIKAGNQELTPSDLTTQVSAQGNQCTISITWNELTPITDAGAIVVSGLPVLPVAISTCTVYTAGTGTSFSGRTIGGSIHFFVGANTAATKTQGTYDYTRLGMTYII